MRNAVRRLALLVLRAVHGDDLPEYARKAERRWKQEEQERHGHVLRHR